MAQLGEGGREAVEKLVALHGAGFPSQDGEYSMLSSAGASSQIIPLIQL
jgi:hypothetical protein